MQLSKILVQMIGLVVLSRLISPEAFGVFAVVAACFAFGEMIRDFGLTSAAIQTRTLNKLQATNLFWLSTALSTVIAAVFAIVSPLLNNVIHLPLELVPIVCVTFLINGAQAQFQVQLTRSYKFGKLAMSDLGAQAFGVAAGISFAAAGLGVWALAIQLVTQCTALLVSRVVLSRWSPGRPSRTPGMLALIRFGVDVGAAQLLGYAASNADVFMIASRFGAGPLGFYSRAFQLLSAPLNQLMAPLTHVFLPALSRAYREGTLAALFLRLQWLVTLGGCGFFVCVAINHQAITLVVLGPAWREAAIYVGILAAGGAIQIVSFTCFWIFLATGKTRQLLAYNFLTKLLTVGLVVAGSFFSVPGVALGYTAGLLVSTLVCIVWTPRLLPLRISAMATSLTGVGMLLAPASIAAGAAVWAVGVGSPWLSLIIGSASYIFVLVATCVLLPNSRRQLSKAYGALVKKQVTNGLSSVEKIQGHRSND